MCFVFERTAAQDDCCTHVIGSQVILSGIAGFVSQTFHFANSPSVQGRHSLWILPEQCEISAADPGAETSCASGRTIKRWVPWQRGPWQRGQTPKTKPWIHPGWTPRAQHVVGEPSPFSLLHNEAFNGDRPSERCLPFQLRDPCEWSVVRVLGYSVTDATHLRHLSDQETTRFSLPIEWHKTT